MSTDTKKSHKKEGVVTESEIVNKICDIFKSDEEAVKTLCEKVRDLSEAVGITQTVKEVGAKKKDFAMLAEKAMEDPCKPGNPREVTQQDFIDLYEKAW